MKIDKETEKRIEQLQLFEQNIHALLNQKQTFQAQLNEIENAIKEVKETKEETYKFVGNIMVKKDKKSLIQDLESKKDMLDLRIEKIDKQEKQIKDNSKKIRDEVMKKMEK